MGEEARQGSMQWARVARSTTFHRLLLEKIDGRLVTACGYRWADGMVIERRNSAATLTADRCPKCDERPPDHIRFERDASGLDVLV